MQDWKLGDSNKSKAYISPILGLNRDGTINSFKYDTFFDKDYHLPSECFVNCFIGDDVNNIEDKVLMLYRFSGKQEFIDFEEFIQRHPLYVDQYDPDKKHVMYVFDIPDIVKPDFELLKEGKYSKVTKTYKDHALRFLGHYDSDNSSIKDVFYKHERAYEALEKRLMINIPRHQEASAKFVREQEYYQEKYMEKESLTGDMDL